MSIEPGRNKGRGILFSEIGGIVSEITGLRTGRGKGISAHP